jgi:hypothetical protein
LELKDQLELLGLLEVVEEELQVLELTQSFFKMDKL